MTWKDKVCRALVWTFPELYNFVNDNFTRKYIVETFSIKNAKSLFSFSKKRYELSHGDYIDIPPLALQIASFTNAALNHNKRFYTRKMSTNEKEYYMGLNARQCGEFIEKEIYNNNNKVPPYLDRGDRIIDGKYIEVKTSLIKNQKDARIARIRPWQNVDYYTVHIYYCSNNTVENFLLSKQQMQKELKTMNAIPMDNTKKANKKNKNIQVSFNLPINSPHHKRWQKKYIWDIKRNEKQEIIF